MAFQQFAFPQVIADLGLSFTDANLFPEVPDEEVSAEFDAAIRDGAWLSSAIDTEKARSEFVIAPILLELRRRHLRTFAIFSGVEMVADANRGLNGVCDFLLTKSLRQHVFSTPIVTIVEAKNDNLRGGLGQCIASMFAAKMLNDAEGNTLPAIYGVVSSGTLWKFLKLSDTTVTIDLMEYQLHELGKILAILGSIVTSFRA